MPKAYKRCVSKVRKSGKSKDSAHAICTKANAGNVKAVRKREAAKRRGK